MKSKNSPVLSKSAAAKSSATKPATKATPAAKPVAKKPAAKPAVKPAAKPVAKATPAAKPAPKKPAAKPAVAKAPAAKPVAPKAVAKPVALKETPPVPPVKTVASKVPAPAKKPVASSRAPKSLSNLNSVNGKKADIPAAPLSLEERLSQLAEKVDLLQKDVARLRQENADLHRGMRDFNFNAMEQAAGAQLRMIQTLRQAANVRPTVVKHVPDDEPGNPQTITIKVTEGQYALYARVEGATDGAPEFVEINNPEVDVRAIGEFLNARKAVAGDVIHANIYLS